MITNDHPAGRQLAAARVLAGLGQADVAEAAHISLPTLRRMEASEGPATGLENNIRAVVAAREAAGVAFIAEGETTTGGPGARLR